MAIDVPDTVALGDVPDPPTDTVTLPSLAPTTSAAPMSTTTAPRTPITGPVGDEVFGNRILLIGDTVLASTAPRFDGVMCDALEAFGWQAEIAAEVGRFVDFGLVVTEELLDPKGERQAWDAAAVMLGNHFDGDVEEFRDQFERVLDELAPRPTIVYTLVEDDTYQATLNEIIRDLPRFRPNVVVIDWAVVVAAEPELLTAETPSGLSDEGRARLALFTAAALGQAPVTSGAGCVTPTFTDDSAIVL